METIGDAYMVVSGVPEENGIRHISHISDISLEIQAVLNFIDNFDLLHLFAVSQKLSNTTSQKSTHLLSSRLSFRNGCCRCCRFDGTAILSIW